VIPAEQALVRRERHMPGLPLLLDDGAFTALLAERLPDAGVHAARATYLRYKPQTSCLVAFHVQTDAGETMVHARAERHGATGRLQRLAALAERQTALGPGAVVLPELALAVLPFPSDRRLPALVALADARARRRLFGADGRLRVLAYKPERRFVARTGGLVVRAYAERQWLAAATAAAAIRPTGDLRVPRCVAVASGSHTLATEWMPGRRLDERLDGTGDDVAGAVALALRALHGSTPARALPVHESVADPEALLAAAGAAAVAGAPTGRRARALAERLGRRLAGRPPGGVVVHGDFSSDQVLLDGDGATLVDLDAAGLGHPSDDLASFAGDLELRVIEGRLHRETADRAVSDLTEAYVGIAPIDAGAEELSLLTAAALLRRVAEPFRHRRPDWPDAVTAVVERATALAARPFRRTTRSRAPLDLLTGLRHDGHEGLPPGPLALQRAWPGRNGDILLEYEGSNGEIVAGRWPADAPGWDASGVEVSTAAGRVALHAGGRDASLPCLADVLERPGARLVSHRPGRRATVHLCDGDESLWIKVVRPGRAEGVAATLDCARRLGRGLFAVPSIRCLDPATDSVTCDGLAGHPLTAVLAAAETPAHVRRVGRALRSFHDQPAPQAATVHDGAAEAGVMLRWVQDLARLSESMAEQAATMANDVAAALEAAPTTAVAPLHRDLHDGQVFLGPSGRLGILDFDTLAAGEPALDIANLLVHFDLRAAQGVCSCDDAARVSEALLTGYGVEPEMRTRMQAYASAARIRLACVYAFRPRWKHLPPRLLAAASVRARKNSAYASPRGTERSRAWMRATSSENENGLAM